MAGETSGDKKMADKNMAATELEYTADDDNKRDEEQNFSADFHRNTSLLYKIIKTISVVLVWLCIGLWAEVNGPTLPDLMYRTKSNYETISQAISMRGAGNLAASILGGGYLVDRFHSKAELILAFCVLLCGLLNTAVPFSPHVELLFAIYVVEGWLEALVNIAGQVIIIDVWNEKASGPLHLIHLGFGAGAFLAPQIVSKFISDNLPKIESDSGDSINCEINKTAILNESSGNSSLVTENTTVISSDTFQYGFMIVSSIIVVISGVWFIYAFMERKKTYARKVSHTTCKEIFDLNTCLPGRPMLAFFLYLLLFIWIYVAVAGERIFAKYLYSYAREFACFKKQEAANLLTGFWVSFTAGRFLGFVGSNFLHMKFIIFIEGFGNLISALVLYFYGTNTTVLWTCVCISGILVGPCYPSGLAWIHRYIHVTATGITILSIGGGVSDISFISTIGFFINKYGIAVMTAFVLGFSVLICILPMLMQYFACQIGDRFQQQQDEDEQTHNSKL